MAPQDYNLLKFISRDLYFGSLVQPNHFTSWSSTVIPTIAVSAFLFQFCPQLF